MFIYDILLGPHFVTHVPWAGTIGAFSLKKIHLKMSSAKCCPFCLGLRVFSLGNAELLSNGSIEQCSVRNSLCIEQNTFQADVWYDLSWFLRWCLIIHDSCVNDRTFSRKGFPWRRWYYRWRTWSHRGHTKAYHPWQTWYVFCYRHSHQWSCRDPNRDWNQNK